MFGKQKLIAELPRAMVDIERVGAGMHAVRI
jgi:hypothetical protein